jgi:hypothetical protein
MIRSGKSRLAVLAIISISLYISLVEVKGGENDLLDTIVAGVAHNNSLIKNISFDYVVDFNVSEEWCNKQLELMPMPIEQFLRAPTLEHTLRTGSATFAGGKFKISSEIIALSDHKLFVNKIVACNGNTVRELDLKGKVGYIYDVNSAPNGDLMFDPRNFPVLFADGQPLHSALTGKNTNNSLVGTEEIDGTKCYIIEMVENFTTPEGTQEQSRKRCWIASDKGHRIKRGVLYKSKSIDSKPLTITDCELIEAAKGIWYYSKVTFRSYPLSSPKPDLIAVLQLDNIVINRELEENTFAITFPEGCIIDDQISRVRYKAGSPLDKLRETLDHVVNEALK